MIHMAEFSVTYTLLSGLITIVAEFSLCFTYSDGETFISADDLRINLWNLEISNQSFNIVDVKPVNMEDLTGKLSQSDVYLWVSCWFDVNVEHANVIKLVDWHCK